MLNPRNNKCYKFITLVMSTFIPFGNTSQMTFSSVNTNELIYANQGLYGIKIPDNVLQVLHGSTPGVYSWSYITPLSMGLTSNVNQMFYTTSDTARYNHWVYAYLQRV